MNKMVEINKVISVDPQNIENSKIASIVNYLREGKVIAFPTDTVYGLEVDFENEKAVKRIFYIKNRSFDKPLMLLISEIDEVNDFAKDVLPSAYKLINKFWPGPLAIILKAKREIFGVTSHDQKIALRIPDNKIALALIKEFKPLTAPSANLSGDESSATTEEVIRTLEDKVDLIVGGGQCEYKKPSTIIDLSNFTPLLLREGSISFTDIMDSYEE